MSADEVSYCCRVLLEDDWSLDTDTAMSHQMKDKEPLQKAKVSQEYLESNGKAQGITCHSASPACIGWSIDSIKYPTAKDYKLLYKERPDMLRLGVSCLYREHHESDPRDINTPFKNTNNCSGELLSENPSRLWGILHIFNFACSWLKAVLKTMRHPQFWRKYGHFMGLVTCQVGSDWLEGQVIR